MNNLIALNIIWVKIKNELSTLKDRYIYYKVQNKFIYIST